MKLKLALFILVSVLLATACSPSAPQAPTPDVVIIRTSAAKTVVSEITLTAAASTATASATSTEAPPTETPTLETPLALDATIASGTAVLCDHLTFNPATVDVNIPDNSEMTAGQQFVKTWKVKNDGGCAWGAGYGMIYAGYTDRMSGQPTPLTGVVAVGQEVDLSVNFKAPTKAGEYVSAWQLANDKGIPFPKVVFVKIVVK